MGAPMNWVSFGFKCAATDFKLGADIMSVTADYLSSKAKELSMKLQGQNLEAAAKRAEEQAGNTQQQGRQTVEQIGLQAGQAKGTAIASAAGSGIDVSSKIVNKAVNDIQKQSRDAQAEAAFNEKQAVQNDINAMLLARQEKVMNDMAINNEKNNRKMQIWGGALTAAGNWFNGMADAAGSLSGLGGK